MITEKKYKMQYRYHLKNYIFQIDNCIDKELCEDTLQQISTINYEPNTFYSPVDQTAKSPSGNQECEVSDEFVPVKNKIMEKINDAVEKYLKEHLNFSWFKECSGISTVRFNRYTENKKMALHCDHIHSLFEGNVKGVPILSIIGVLNDDYKGGNFIMFDEYEIKFKQGDVIIFPSNFMYPHKVEPVTQGVRHSFVSWVC